VKSAVREDTRPLDGYWVAASALTLLSEVIGVDPLHVVGRHRTDTEVVVDHQVRELLAIDEGNLVLDLALRR
jgi:hypothetical protein